MNTSEDVLNWCIDNYDYIDTSISLDLQGLYIAARIFDKSPDLYDELVDKARLTKLRELLTIHLNLTPEEILVTIDQEFSIMVFRNIKKLREQYEQQN